MKILFFLLTDLVLIEVAHKQLEEATWPETVQSVALSLEQKSANIVTWTEQLSKNDPFFCLHLRMDFFLSLLVLSLDLHHHSF